MLGTWGFVHCAKLTPPALCKCSGGFLFGVRYPVAGLAESELSKVSKLCFHCLYEKQAGFKGRKT
jgi:hypothetical protein